MIFFLFKDNFITTSINGAFMDNNDKQDKADNDAVLRLMKKKKMTIVIFKIMPMIIDRKD